MPVRQAGIHDASAEAAAWETRRQDEPRLIIPRAML